MLHGRLRQLNRTGCVALAVPNQQPQPASAAGARIRVRRWQPDADAPRIGQLWQEALLMPGLTSFGSQRFDARQAAQLQEAVVAQLWRCHTRKLQARQAQDDDVADEDGGVGGRGAARARTAALRQSGRQRTRARRRRMWACLVAVGDDAQQACPASPQSDVAGRRPADELLGYLIINLAQPLALLPPPLPSRSPLVAHIDALAVAPLHRRKGVASRLLDAAEKLAARWGNQSLWLEVDASNLSAVQLYFDRGYRVVRALGWPWRPARKLVMRKPLVLRRRASELSHGGPDSASASSGQPEGRGVYVWGRSHANERAD